MQRILALSIIAIAAHFIIFSASTASAALRFCTYSSNPNLEATLGIAISSHPISGLIIQEPVVVQKNKCLYVNAPNIQNSVLNRLDNLLEGKELDDLDIYRDHPNWFAMVPLLLEKSEIAVALSLNREKPINRKHAYDICVAIPKFVLVSAMFRVTIENTFDNIGCEYNKYRLLDSSSSEWISCDSELSQYNCRAITVIVNELDKMTGVVEEKHVNTLNEAGAGQVPTGIANIKDSFAGDILEQELEDWWNLSERRHTLIGDMNEVIENYGIHRIVSRLRVSF